MTTVFPVLHTPDDPGADTVDMTTQTLIVRPIVFTAAAGRWRALLDLLGARTLSFHPEWSIHALPGGGRVAVHATDGEPHCDLGFEVPGRATLLAAVGGALHAAGGRLHEVLGGQGPTLRLVLPDGVAMWIDDAAADPGGEPPAVSAQAVVSAPLHVTTQPTEVAAAYRALGLRPGLSADGGGWHDLHADGALCVHAAATMSGPPAVESFWAPDVDALAENLRAAGVRCDVVDEAYGRTLLVEHPDHPEPVEGEPELPGRRLWITETQTDTYGYTDHGHGVAHEAHPDQGRAARA